MGVVTAAASFLAANSAAITTAATIAQAGSSLLQVDAQNRANQETMRVNKLEAERIAKEKKVAEGKRISLIDTMREQADIGSNQYKTLTGSELGTSLLEVLG